jgi:hypothetical protein
MDGAMETLPRLSFGKVHSYMSPASAAVEDAGTTVAPTPFRSSCEPIRLAVLQPLCGSGIAAGGPPSLWFQQFKASRCRRISCVTISLFRRH